MLSNCAAREDSWESLGQQGDQVSQFSKSNQKSTLNIHWKDWCWCWSSSTLATRFEELTHQKRPWWWERLKSGGEGNDRGWDGCMTSLTPWTWVEQALGDGEGHRSLVCYSPWGCIESDTTERLTNNKRERWGGHQQQLMGISGALRGLDINMI